MAKDRKSYVKWSDLSPRRRQNVLNEVQNGQMKQSTAAGLLGVDQATISRKLRDQNLNPIGRPRKGTVVVRGRNSPPLQSSQKTLRSWLAHPLTPEKTGQPSSTEVPNAVTMTVGTEKEVTEDKAACPLCGQVRVSKLNRQSAEKCQENVWSDVKKSATGEFLSARLTGTVLILPTQGDCFRRYARTNSFGATEYFRCTHCASLRQKEGGQTPLAKVMVQDGLVVGDADPEHHPNCLPLQRNEVLAQQHDREARLLLSQGKMQNPREAWNKVRSLQNFHSLHKYVFSMFQMFRLMTTVAKVLQKLEKG